MCWAWCLQQAARQVLQLEQRSLDLECLEHAAADMGGDDQQEHLRPVNPARTSWRHNIRHNLNQLAAGHPVADQLIAIQQDADQAAANEPVKF